jgi:hypothetical protein
MGAKCVVIPQRDETIHPDQISTTAQADNIPNRRVLLRKKLLGADTVVGESVSDCCGIKPCIRVYNERLLSGQHPFESHH